MITCNVQESAQTSWRRHGCQVRAAVFYPVPAVNHVFGISWNWAGFSLFRSPNWN